MRPRGAALVVALAVVVLGCGEGDARTAEPTSSLAASASITPTTSTTTSTPTTSTTTTSTTILAAPGAGRPYETEVVTATYVDESRVTPAGSQTDQEPARTLDVWIDLPLTDEPRPLVVFAHGLTGHPRTHEQLRAHLAAEGFIVASPAFPLTNSDVPGAGANAGDTGEQVNDVSFLIDAIRADPEIGPRVAAGPVGLVGHSLGGVTTAGAAVIEGSRDERIGAAVVMSAGIGVGATDAIPVMVVHGDQDATVPYDLGVSGYAALTGRRIFVTLVDGNHITGILDDDSDQGRALRGLTAAFLADALGVDEGQIAAIGELPLDAVTVRAGGPAGELGDWRDYFSSSAGG